MSEHLLAWNIAGVAITVLAFVRGRGCLNTLINVCVGGGEGGVSETTLWVLGNRERVCESGIRQRRDGAWCDINNPENVALLV